MVGSFFLSLVFQGLKKQGNRNWAAYMVWMTYIVGIVLFFSSLGDAISLAWLINYPN